MPAGGPRSIAAENALDLSVILPAFNEGAIISRSLDRLSRHLAAAGGDYEILVVDDGSLDGTASSVLARAKIDPRIRLIGLGRNHGKGAALAKGVAEARGRVIATTDADLSYDLPGLDAVVGAVREGAALAGGNRSHPDSRIDLPFRLIPYLARRWAAGALFRLTVGVLFRLWGVDTQCGLKAFSAQAGRAIFPRLRTRRFLADIEIFILARETGLKTAQVPVRLEYLSKASSVGMLADLPGALADLYQIARGSWGGLYGPRQVGVRPGEPAP